MEIKRKELRSFLVSWLVSRNVNIDLKMVIDLLDLIDECYEDKMMFNSWFRGINVMN